MAENIIPMEAELKKLRSELITLRGEAWRICMRKINTLKQLIIEARNG